MKILVADDHALIREGMRMVLRQFDTQVECVDAVDGAAVRQALRDHPDVELLLLDRRLPDCDGVVLLEELIDSHPTLPVVMMSAELDADVVSHSIEVGAVGFIPKSSVTTVLVQALRLIMAGGVYVPPEMLRREPRTARMEATSATAPPRQQADPLQDLHRPAAPAEGTAPTVADRSGYARPSSRPMFTDRQAEVFALLMQGKSNKQISRELDLAEATVKVHVRSILRALDASSRPEAVVTASRLGLNPDTLRRAEPTSR